MYYTYIAGIKAVAFIVARKIVEFLELLMLKFAYLMPNPEYKCNR